MDNKINILKFFNHIILGFIVTLTAFSATQAQAQTADYVGVWGASKKRCNAGFTTEDGAFEITKKNIVGFEWKCDIDKIEYKRQKWNAILSCTMDGIKSERSVSWIVVQKNLVEIENGAIKTFTNCGSR